MAEISQTQWLTQGQHLFGDDWMSWQFECPICHNVATPRDFKKLGADPQRAYQECIGRVLPGQPARDLATKPGSNGKKQPCDYAAFGLFRISPAPQVVPHRGKPVHVFPFAKQEPATGTAVTDAATTPDSEGGS